MEHIRDAIKKTEKKLKEKQKGYEYTEREKRDRNKVRGTDSKRPNLEKSVN